MRYLPCGHACAAKCNETCRCTKCTKGKGKAVETATNRLRNGSPVRTNSSASASASEAGAWHTFVKEEHTTYLEEQAATVRKLAALDQRQTLVDIGSAEPSAAAAWQLRPMPAAADRPADDYEEKFPLLSATNRSTGERKTFKETYRVNEQPRTNLLD